eukprot:TRINITY_DN69002_c0_g1_i1.p1 TRINITY_DN69002_c0_g1~~TRINITY_DN69002_c0_g1_i1.p1  ORF type:complete len:353 (-),score=46.14 TRINITY_DN69002_c0_g1_i1:71-1129(-)
MGAFFGTYSHEFRNSSQYAAKLLICEDPEALKKHCSAKIGLNLGGGVTGGYGADFQSMVARDENGRPVQEMSIQPGEEKTISMNSTLAFVTGGFRMTDGQFKVFWKNRSCPHTSANIILDKHFEDINADIYPTMEAAMVGNTLPHQTLPLCTPGNLMPLPQAMQAAPPPNQMPIPNTTTSPLSPVIPPGMFPLLTNRYKIKSSDGKMYDAQLVGCAVAAGADTVGTPFPPGTVVAQYSKDQGPVIKFVHPGRLSLDLYTVSGPGQAGFGIPASLPAVPLPPNVLPLYTSAKARSSDQNVYPCKILSVAVAAGADTAGQPFLPGSVLVEYTKVGGDAWTKVVHPERVALDLIV